MLHTSSPISLAKENPAGRASPLPISPRFSDTTQTIQQENAVVLYAKFPYRGQSFLQFQRTTQTPILLSLQKKYLLLYLQKKSSKRNDTASQTTQQKPCSIWRTNQLSITHLPAVIKQMYPNTTNMLSILIENKNQESNHLVLRFDNPSIASQLTRNIAIASQEKFTQYTASPRMDSKGNSRMYLKDPKNIESAQPKIIERTNVSLMDALSQLTVDDGTLKKKNVSAKRNGHKSDNFLQKLFSPRVRKSRNKSQNSKTEENQPSSSSLKIIQPTHEEKIPIPGQVYSTPIALQSKHLPKIVTAEEVLEKSNDLAHNMNEINSIYKTWNSISQGDQFKVDQLNDKFIQEFNSYINSKVLENIKLATQLLSNLYSFNPTGIGFVETANQKAAWPLYLPALFYDLKTLSDDELLKLFEKTPCFWNICIQAFCSKSEEFSNNPKIKLDISEFFANIFHICTHIVRLITVEMFSGTGCIDQVDKVLAHSFQDEISSNISQKSRKNVSKKKPATVFQKTGFLIYRFDDGECCNQLDSHLSTSSVQKQSANTRPPSFQFFSDSPSIIKKSLAENDPDTVRIQTDIFKSNYQQSFTPQFKQQATEYRTPFVIAIDYCGFQFEFQAPFLPVFGKNSSFAPVVPTLQSNLLLNWYKNYSIVLEKTQVFENVYLNPLDQQLYQFHSHEPLPSTYKMFLASAKTLDIHSRLRNILYRLEKSDLIGWWAREHSLVFDQQLSQTFEQEEDTLVEECALLFQQSQEFNALLTVKNAIQDQIEILNAYTHCEKKSFLTKTQNLLKLWKGYTRGVYSLESTTRLSIQQIHMCIESLACSIIAQQRQPVDLDSLGCVIQNKVVQTQLKRGEKCLNKTPLQSQPTIEKYVIGIQPYLVHSSHQQLFFPQLAQDTNNQVNLSIECALLQKWAVVDPFIKSVPWAIWEKRPKNVSNMTCVYNNQDLLYQSIEWIPTPKVLVRQMADQLVLRLFEMCQKSHNPVSSQKSLSTALKLYRSGHSPPQFGKPQGSIFHAIKLCYFHPGYAQPHHLLLVNNSSTTTNGNMLKMLNNFSFTSSATAAETISNSKNILNETVQSKWSIPTIDNPQMAIPVFFSYFHCAFQRKSYMECIEQLTKFLVQYGAYLNNENAIKSLVRVFDHFFKTCLHTLVECTKLLRIPNHKTSFIDVVDSFDSQNETPIGQLFYLKKLFMLIPKCTITRSKSIPDSTLIFSSIEESAQFSNANSSFENVYLDILHKECHNEKDQPHLQLFQAFERLGQHLGEISLQTCQDNLIKSRLALAASQCWLYSAVWDKCVSWASFHKSSSGSCQNRQSLEKLRARLFSKYQSSFHESLKILKFSCFAASTGVKSSLLKSNPSTGLKNNFQILRQCLEQLGYSLLWYSTFNWHLYGLANHQPAECGLHGLLCLFMTTPLPQSFALLPEESIIIDLLKELIGISKSFPSQSQMILPFSVLEDITQYAQKWQNQKSVYSSSMKGVSNNFQETSSVKSSIHPTDFFKASVLVWDLTKVQSCYKPYNALTQCMFFWVKRALVPEIQTKAQLPLSKNWAVQLYGKNSKSSVAANIAQFQVPFCVFSSIQEHCETFDLIKSISYQMFSQTIINGLGQKHGNADEAFLKRIQSTHPSCTISLPTSSTPNTVYRDSLEHSLLVLQNRQLVQVENLEKMIKYFFIPTNAVRPLMKNVISQILIFGPSRFIKKVFSLLDDPRGKHVADIYVHLACCRVLVEQAVKNFS